MSAAVITYERIECTLRDGTLVLGKEYKGETFPKTYANRTQAERAAQKEAGDVIQRGRPFYVRLLPAVRPDILERLGRCTTERTDQRVLEMECGNAAIEIRRLRAELAERDNQDQQRRTA